MKLLRTPFFTKHFRWLLLEGVGEGASLVKLLHDCRFNMFGINHRCFGKMLIMKNNEQTRLLKRLPFLLFYFQGRCSQKNKNIGYLAGNSGEQYFNQSNEKNGDFCAEVICSYFNDSLNQGKIHNWLKLTNINPVFKKCPRTSKNNYKRVNVIPVNFSQGIQYSYVIEDILLKNKTNSIIIFIFSNATARVHRQFLHLTIAIRVGSSISSDKES